MPMGQQTSRTNPRLGGIRDLDEGKASLHLASRWGLLVNSTIGAKEDDNHVGVGEFPTWHHGVIDNSATKDGVQLSHLTSAIIP